MQYQCSRRPYRGLAKALHLEVLEDRRVLFGGMNPSIEVVTTVDPTTIMEGVTGTDVTYSYLLTNTSPETDGGGMLSDPVTLTNLDDSILGPLAGDADCQVGTVLAPGATCSFEVLVTLPAANAGASVVNLFTATATDDENNSVSDDDDATVTYTDVAPAIQVTKDVVPTAVSEGGVGSHDVTYTFQVTNSSPASTDPISITALADSLLGPLAGDVDCQVGTVLAPGASCSFEVLVTLPAANAGTSVVNLFTATATDDENNSVSDDDDVTVTYTDVAPAIQVTKDVVPTAVSEGGVGSHDVTYTYQVTNSSPASTDPLTITSLVDSVLGPLTGDADCQVGTVLAPGAACSFEVLVTLPAANAGASVVNLFTATATDDENNSVSDDDDATVTYTDVAPAIQVTKDVIPTAVSEGGVGSHDVTYTFQVTNSSPASTDPISITALADSLLGPLAGDADCQVGTVLAPGAACSFEVLATLPAANAGTSVVNLFTATATDDENNSVSDDDDATVTYTDVAPVIQVTKDVVPTAVSEGGVGSHDVTYTFQVTNSSPASTDPISITALADSLLGPLTGDADCQVGTVLAPGATCSFEVLVTLPAANAGIQLTNSITVVAVDDEGIQASGLATASVVYENVLPNLGVTKSASATSVPEGGVGNPVVTFTYTLVNNSPAASDPLVLVSLVDDNGSTGNVADDLNIVALGTLVGGDTNANGLIDAGETWTYQLAVTVPIGNVGQQFISRVLALARDDETSDTTDTDATTTDYSNVIPTMGVTVTADKTVIPNTGGAVKFVYLLDNTSMASTDPLVVDSLMDDNGTPVMTADDVNILAAPGVMFSGDANMNGQLDGNETWTYQVIMAASGTPPSRVNKASAFFHDNEASAGMQSDTTSIQVVDGDFSDDGVYTCKDIDGLIAEIVAQTNFPLFDLDRNGLVNLADRNLWLTIAAQSHGLSVPYLLGDANLDGSVDGSDFGIWNSNRFTLVARWCAGDFNATGAVDGSDFAIWNANKFQSAFVPYLPRGTANENSQGHRATWNRGLLADPLVSTGDVGWDVRMRGAAVRGDWPERRGTAPARIRVHDVVLAEMAEEWPFPEGIPAVPWSGSLECLQCRVGH